MTSVSMLFNVNIKIVLPLRQQTSGEMKKIKALEILTVVRRTRVYTRRVVQHPVEVYIRNGIH